MNKLRVFVDGACSGNPGPGGFGILIQHAGGEEKTYFGGESFTTNNRMELRAAIEALRQLPTHEKVSLYTDSMYVKNGITEWMPGWIRKGWKNSKGEPVKNQDLWQDLAKEVKRHQVEWHWVKGHSGHRENEMVDQLARQAIQTLLEDSGAPKA